MHDESGVSFWSWTGDATGTNPTIYMTMNRNCNVHAVFMGTMTDFEGNAYRTVKIGRQVWTADNLRTTHYNDGTEIPFLPDSAGWCRDVGYCYYNNTMESDSIKKFGALYNGKIAMNPLLAPAGWHVSSSAEWSELTNYLEIGGYTPDGSSSNLVSKAMAAQTDWIATDVNGSAGRDQGLNNSSGFSAPPAGRRHSGGSFGDGGRWAHWWCSDARTYPSSFSLSNDTPGYWTGAGVPEIGYSIRLVKDR